MRPYHGQHKSAPGKGHNPAPKGKVSGGGNPPGKSKFPGEKLQRSSKQLDTGGFAKSKPAMVSNPLRQKG